MNSGEELIADCASDISSVKRWILDRLSVSQYYLKFGRKSFSVLSTLVASGKGEGQAGSRDPTI